MKTGIAFPPNADSSATADTKNREFRGLVEFLRVESSHSEQSLSYDGLPRPLNALKERDFDGLGTPSYGAGRNHKDQAMSKAERPSAELLEQYRNGSESAAGEMFERYVDRLTRLARARLSTALARRLDP